MLAREVRRAERPARAGAPAARPRPAAYALQRTAGNAAVAALLQRSIAVQRDPDTDLTGTPFEAFAPGLKTALLDRAKFPRPGKTLAQALNDYSNLSIAALARIGSRIDALGLNVIWDGVTSFPRPDQGAWATDNLGIPFGMDLAKMTAICDGLVKKGDPSSPLCVDNDPFLAKIHPGATKAWRECVSGGAGLHVVPGQDIHLDYHQPSKGADDKGFCDNSYGLTGAGHLLNYAGVGGARDTTIAKFARLRDQARTEKNDKADALLAGVSDKVTKYAAMGNYAKGESESEGDVAITKDTDVMTAVNAADELLNPTPDPVYAGGF